MSERILCAAIWWPDGKTHLHQPKNVTSGWVVCGRRHHNCLVILKQMGRKAEDRMVQGFLTDLDRFIDRNEAAKIAADYGITIKTGSVLTSEDLY